MRTYKPRPSYDRVRTFLVLIEQYEVEAAASKICLLYFKSKKLENDKKTTDLKNHQSSLIITIEHIIILPSSYKNNTVLVSHTRSIIFSYYYYYTSWSIRLRTELLPETYSLFVLCSVWLISASNLDDRPPEFASSIATDRGH